MAPALAKPGRISQLLPTVRCSNCYETVRLAELGEHICPSYPSSRLTSKKGPRARFEAVDYEEAAARLRRKADPQIPPNGGYSLQSPPPDGYLPHHQRQLRSPSQSDWPYPNQDFLLPPKGHTPPPQTRGDRQEVVPDPGYGLPRQSTPSRPGDSQRPGSVILAPHLVRGAAFPIPRQPQEQPSMKARRSKPRKDFWYEDDDSDHGGQEGGGWWGAPSPPRLPRSTSPRTNTIPGRAYNKEQSAKGLLPQQRSNGDGRGGWYMEGEDEQGEGEGQGEYEYAYAAHQAQHSWANPQNWNNNWETNKARYQNQNGWNADPDYPMDTS